jgi:gluconolactonase
LSALAFARLNLLSANKPDFLSSNKKMLPDLPVKIEVFNKTLESIIDPEIPVEVLGTGYNWSEGPAWDTLRQRLYFTDVPANKAYTWTRTKGVETFLDPSGAVASETYGFREPGANGLFMSRDGRLLICNHGRRSIEAMDINTGKRDTLVSSYQGMAFNSPNDLIQAKNGDIYFTDPPYGLEGLNESPLKEMKANGVYCLSVDGEIKQLLDDMTFPNGILLSNDERYLFVSQSDPKEPIIRRIDLSSKQDNNIIWFDARQYSKNLPGLPDGMALSATGHIFATGPGGVLILGPGGDLLGRINPGSAAANCTFGDDGTSLFITAHSRLLVVKTRVKGAAWA